MGVNLAHLVVYLLLLLFYFVSGKLEHDIFKLSIKPRYSGELDHWLYTCIKYMYFARMFTKIFPIYSRTSMAQTPLGP